MTPTTGLALLLADEFDSRPPPPPDLEALLAAARADALTQARAACDAEGTLARQALASACADLAAGLTAALAALDTALTDTAEALAGSMVAALATALPGWQQRLGTGACAEVATRLLAALGETAALRLAAAPQDAAELRALLPAEITIEQDTAMAPGALRLVWRNGRARRDPMSIWHDITTIMTTAMAPPAQPGAKPAVGVPPDGTLTHNLPSDSETE